MSDLSSVWDPASQRKTVSIPITTNKASNSNSKPQRKTAHYIHKANTIGIPSEGDFCEGVNSIKSTTLNKPKLTFLEGFKNTLRSKHKNDTGATDSSSKETDKQNDLQRRWSEANQPTVNKLKLFDALLFRL